MIRSRYVCRCVLICVLPLTMFSTVFAQYPGYKAITNLNAVRSEFITAAAKVQSLESDFVQEKTLFALTEKITSHGKFWFKRDSKIRMDYVAPFDYKMIINGSRMYVRDGQKESQVNIRSNKLFQQVNQIMISCMQGTVLENKEFNTRIFENGPNLLMELTPVGGNLKQLFEAILLTIEKKDSSPVAIQLNESSGDTTLITLSNKKVNGVLRDEIFYF